MYTPCVFTAHSLPTNRWRPLVLHLQAPITFTCFEVVTKSPCVIYSYYMTITFIISSLLVMLCFYLHLHHSQATKNITYVLTVWSLLTMECRPIVMHLQTPITFTYLKVALCVIQLLHDHVLHGSRDASICYIVSTTMQVK